MNERVHALPPSLRVTAVEHAWRADLDAEARRLTFERLRPAAIVFLIAHLLAFVAFGAWSLAHGVTRLVVIAIYTTVIGLTYVGRLERLAYPLSLAASATTVVYVVGWGAVYPESLDVAGVPLTLMVSASLFPYTRRQMIVACAGACVIALAGGLFMPPMFAAQHVFDVVAASAIAITASSMSWRLREAQAEAHAEAQHERHKSDELLLNILPGPIVERLKRAPNAVAQRFDEATVLFVDIVGFTPLSSELGPTALVDVLNDLFSRFDERVAARGLEKIKTIGDAYMVAAGVPEPRDDHATAMAALALELRDIVSAFPAPGGRPLQARIGLHSGPVVAGVIGKHKFSYDLWGDTVNLASRMESHAEIGTIQLTAATRAALGEDFVVVERGPIEVKGKGEVHAWRLESHAA